jgi:hypothetical protein
MLNSLLISERSKKLQKNAHTKRYKETNLTDMSKSGKRTFFHHIFVNNFLRVKFFCNFFNSFEISKKPLFANFEAKSAQIGSK